MSLTHAIHPYVCPVTSPDPGVGDYLLVMYEAFSYSPNPMQQSQPVSVNVSVGNAGTGTFNGSFKLVLLNANNTEVQVIGQQSLSSPLTSMIYTPLTFSGTITVPAGTYQMALYYQATGTSTWTLVSNSSGVANPVNVNVTGGSTPPITGSGLNMYTDFVYTPDPLRQNTVAYVTVGVINLDNTAFTGNLRLALETPNGEHVQTIQQIPVSTPVAVNSYGQINFSGNITAAPGFYNLILYYKPTGGSTWMTVGSDYNASFQNPKSVMVAYPNGIDDHAMDAARLRPNPATDHFYLDVNDQTIDKMEIFTTTGQLVHTQSNVLNGESIDISFLNSGVYFVRYKMPDNVGTLKLVVK
ncbi:MAG: T9SS type A sorting domain-containing protein [Bacteroidales bacterium]|nr:T9SS type A sorting domain-containing protein [Bacteroidales bacterium]